MARAPDIYELLTNEEDARLCRDISDDACRESPGNFMLLLMNIPMVSLFFLFVDIQPILYKIAQVPEEYKIDTIILDRYQPASNFNSG